MSDAGATSAGVPAAEPASGDRSRPVLAYVATFVVFAAALVPLIERFRRAGTTVFATTGRMHVPGAAYGSGNIDVPFGEGICWAFAIAAAAVAVMPLWPRSTPRLAVRTVLAPSRRAFLTTTFLAVFLIANAISCLVFDHHPRDVDHIARVFQARTLAAGSLSVPTPPVPEAFDAYGLLEREGKTFAKYAPGGAILLAAWYRMTGLLWGIHPLLGALIPLLLYGTFRRWYCELTARTAAGLACVSPFFLFMTASFHGHVPCLFFLAVFLYAFARAWPSGPAAAAVAAGGALALAFATRPYTAMLFGWPFVLYVAFLCRSRRDLMRLAAFGFGFAVPIAALFAYNAAVTGNALLFPFHLADADQLPWFGHKGHTLVRGLANTLGMLKLLGLASFGSPIGLVFAVGALVLAKSRWDRLLLAAAASLVAGYTTYYWTDYSNGPRYYFEAMPTVLLFTAKGLVHVRDVLERSIRTRLVPDAPWRFAAGLAAATLVFSAVLYLPALIPVYADDYNGNYNLDLEHAVDRDGVTNALVFIAPLPGQNAGYGSAVLANPLDLQVVSRLDRARMRLRARHHEEPSTNELAVTTGLDANAVREAVDGADVVYARDLGGVVCRRVIDAFPGRSLYRYRFDPASGTGTFENFGTFDDLRRRARRGSSVNRSKTTPCDAARIHDTAVERVRLHPSPR